MLKMVLSTIIIISFLTGCGSSDDSGFSTEGIRNLPKIDSGKTTNFVPEFSFNEPREIIEQPAPDVLPNQNNNSQEVQNLRSTLSRIEEERNQALQRASELEKEVEAAKSDGMAKGIETSSAEVNELKSNLDDAYTALDEKDIEITEIQKKLSSALNKNEDYETDIADLNDKIVERDDSIVEQARIVEELNQKIAELEGQIVSSDSNENSEELNSERDKLIIELEKEKAILTALLAGFSQEEVMKVKDVVITENELEEQKVQQILNEIFIEEEETEEATEEENLADTDENTNEEATEENEVRDIESKTYTIKMNEWHPVRRKIKEQPKTTYKSHDEIIDDLRAARTYSLMKKTAKPAEKVENTTVTEESATTPENTPETIETTQVLTMEEIKEAELQTITHCGEECQKIRAERKKAAEAAATETEQAEETAQKQETADTTSEEQTTVTEKAQEEETIEEQATITEKPQEEAEATTADTTSEEAETSDETAEQTQEETPANEQIEVTGTNAKGETLSIEKIFTPTTEKKDLVLYVSGIEGDLNLITKRLNQINKAVDSSKPLDHLNKTSSVVVSECQDGMFSDFSGWLNFSFNSNEPVKKCSYKALTKKSDTEISLTAIPTGNQESFVVENIVNTVNPTAVIFIAEMEKSDIAGYDGPENPKYKKFVNFISLNEKIQNKNSMSFNDSTCLIYVFSKTLLDGDFTEYSTNRCKIITRKPE